MVFGPGSSLQQATTDWAVLASACADWPVLLSVPNESSAAKSASAIEFPYILYGGKASSKITWIMPSCWKAGDCMIIGTYFSRNTSAANSPPWWLFGSPVRLSPLQVASCASEQLLGVIQENSGVVRIDFRSCAIDGIAGWPVVAWKPSSGTTSLQSCGSSVSEWNQGAGLCFGTYSSVASAPPGSGTPAPDGSPGMPHS